VPFYTTKKNENQVDFELRNGIVYGIGVGYVICGGFFLTYRH
jgi:hypothetical protein